MNDIDKIIDKIAAEAAREQRLVLELNLYLQEPYDDELIEACLAKPIKYAIEKATEEARQNAYNDGWVAGRDALRAAEPECTACANVPSICSEHAPRSTEAAAIHKEIQSGLETARKTPQYAQEGRELAAAAGECSANVYIEHYFPKGYNPDEEPWKSIKRHHYAALSEARLHERFAAVEYYRPKLQAQQQDTERLASECYDAGYANGENDMNHYERGYGRLSQESRDKNKLEAIDAAMKQERDITVGSGGCAAVRKQERGKEKEK